MPRTPLKHRRLLAAMLDDPAVTDVAAQILALKTAFFRQHGPGLVAYCRYALEAGDSSEALREFMLAGNTVIYAPDPADGPMFLILDAILIGDRPAELNTPAAAADAEAIVDMARDSLPAAGGPPPVRSVTHVKPMG